MLGCLRNPRFKAAVEFGTGALLISLVAAIFGGYSVVSSSVFHDCTVSPLVYAFLRDCIGTTLLLSAAFFTQRGKKREDGSDCWKMQRKDFFSFFLLGVSGVYGSQVMSALAIKFTTSAFFSSLSNLQPVVTVLLSMFWGLERFQLREATTWGKLAGITLTVSAAIALVMTSSGGTSSGDFLNFGLGIGYLTLQVCLGGALGPLQKPLFSSYTPLVLAGWGYLIGTCLLAMIVVCAATNAVDWNITPKAVMGIAYAGILSSGVAYGLLAFVNSLLGPSFVAAFLPTQALFAALFSWLFQGKTLPPVGLAMAVLMIVGVLTIVGAQYRESKLGLLSPFAAAERAEKAKKEAKGEGDEGDEAALLKKSLLSHDQRLNPLDASSSSSSSSSSASPAALWAAHSPLSDTAAVIDLPASYQRQQKEQEEEAAVKAWR